MSEWKPCVEGGVSVLCHPATVRGQPASEQGGASVRWAGLRGVGVASRPPNLLKFSGRRTTVAFRPMLGRMVGGGAALLPGPGHLPVQAVREGPSRGTGGPEDGERRLLEAPLISLSVE